MSNVYGPAWMSHYDVERRLVIGGIVLESNQNEDTREQFGRELWQAAYLVAFALVEWRAIPFLHGLYEVSSIGTIRSLFAGRRRRLIPLPIKTYVASTGYLAFTARVSGKQHTTTVHAALLSAFVGPRPINKEAAHLNGVRTDSTLWNLQWVTRKENMAHKHLHGTAQIGENGTGAKLTKEALLEILRRVQTGFSVKEAVVGFGIKPAAIYDVRCGKTWVHFPDIQRLRAELWPEKGRKWSKNRPANLAHTTKFGLHFARRGLRGANRPST